MSQNNTQAPGIGDIYSRGASSATNGTVVPGMHKAATDTPDTPVTAPTAPVVGFLYSISRKGIGEYWPVHIGRNKIGCDADCDVILKEGTVSGIHALLNVKQLKSDHRLVAQIRDEGSKNGITVNGEELDFGMYDCKNNDIIKIGDNYELLLLLVNANEYGLKVAENFMALEGDDEFAPNVPPFSGYDNTNSPYSGANRASNGTMAIDGVDNLASGGTKFL